MFFLFVCFYYLWEDIYWINTNSFNQLHHILIDRCQFIENYNSWSHYISFKLHQPTIESAVCSVVTAPLVCQCRHLLDRTSVAASYIQLQLVTNCSCWEHKKAPSGLSHCFLWFSCCCVCLFLASVNAHSWVPASQPQCSVSLHAWHSSRHQ